MFSWHAIPFARLLAPLTAGILMAVYIPFGPIVPVALLIICLILLLLLGFQKKIALQFRNRIFTGVLLSLTLVLLGYCRTYFYDEEHQPCHFTAIESPKLYGLVIDDAVIEKSKFYRSYAKVVSVTDSGGNHHEVKGTLLLYIRKSQNILKPRIGDRYTIKSTAIPVNGPLNPGEFDYRRYLGYHNIGHQLFGDSSNAIRSGMPLLSVYRYAVQLRDHSLSVIETHITSPQELGVAEALLLGFKDHLDPEITGAFSRTGTLHVLAVSGLHAGIIYLILAFITAPLVKKRSGKILQVILILSGIWLYAFVTGLSSSVLRASVMFSFMATGKLLKYHVNIYNIIFSSAFLLLIYNPYFLMDVGFQLSYLAVLGIVFVQPMIAKWYIPKSSIGRYVWGLISVSLAAQILTFPISLFYFHQFPNYFLLSNLLIIPVTSLILVGLIALLAFHSIPVAGPLLGKAISALLSVNNNIVQNIDHLPYSYVNGIHFDFFQMLLCYVILLLFLSFCIHQRKYLLFACMSFSLVLCLYLNYLGHIHQNQRILTIHNIKGHDVFTCLDGKTATIIADSGFINNANSIRFYLEPYFWSHGISNIEKQDFQKTFVKTTIKNIKNRGFQFYDRILTIDAVTIQKEPKNEICYLMNAGIKNVTAFSHCPKTVKFSINIKNHKKIMLKKYFFNHFKKIVKDHKSFILISF